MDRVHRHVEGIPKDFRNDRGPCVPCKATSTIGRSHGKKLRLAEKAIVYNVNQSKGIELPEAEPRMDPATKGVDILLYQNNNAYQEGEEIPSNEKAVIFSVFAETPLAIDAQSESTLDTTHFADVQESLQVEMEENARLKANYDTMIKSLLVKSEILKANLAAKEMSSASYSWTAPTNKYLVVFREQAERQARSSPTFKRTTQSNDRYLPHDPQFSETAGTAAGAVAAAAGYAASMDSTEPTGANGEFNGSPTKSVQHYQVSSFNCVSPDIDHSDVTSSLIEIRTHQGDLQLLLQEADEEGLSTDLMASIESTVAETTKIYSDLMTQRCIHPINRIIIGGDFNMDAREIRKIDDEIQQRKIAAVILKRLSQQELMSLHGSWQAQRQKVELIQQKQSQLEVMRTSLADVIQNKTKADQVHGAGDGTSDSDSFNMNINCKEKAGTFLAFHYLAKTARQVYLEEWDAVNIFEGTCCDILGSYNTAIMYAKSAPNSPNCAAIAKEILSLAAKKGRLCMAN